MTSGMILHPIRLGLAFTCALAGLYTLSSAPARADLRVCNETPNLISVSLGYRAERGWLSEGWWQAPPGDCRVLYQGTLERRFYYVFAADDIGGGAWDGSVFMCTRDETFTIFGVEDCLARGYERTGFFEIDTQNRSDWTIQLKDNDGVPSIAGSDGTDDTDPRLLIDAPEGAPLEGSPPPGSSPPDGNGPPPGGGAEPSTTPDSESMDTQ